MIRDREKPPASRDTPPERRTVQCFARMRRSGQLLVVSPTGRRVLVRDPAARYSSLVWEVLNAQRRAKDTPAHDKMVPVRLTPDGMADLLKNGELQDNKEHYHEVQH